jgi:hypothetical protein
VGQARNELKTLESETIIAEHEELAADTLCAPGRVLVGHGGDKLPNDHRDRVVDLAGLSFALLHRVESRAHIEPGGGNRLGGGTTRCQQKTAWRQENLIAGIATVA